MVFNPSTLDPELIAELENVLDVSLTTTIPGAAVAIISPNGNWFGAGGVSDIATNTPLQPTDRFEIGSITKTFVAVTLLQLVEAGQLTLEDTLTQWLPASVTDGIPNAADITIEQILRHTSGIADYTEPLFALAATNPFVFLEEWQPEQLVEFITDIEPLFAPGESWEYSNTNFILAGLVIESVTGNPIASEIRDRILTPLNLENTFFAVEEPIPGDYINGYWDFDRNNTLDDITVTNLSWAWAAGAMVSNTADLATFAEGLFKGALLQPDMLARMLDRIPVDSPNYDSYGLGIGTIESPNRFWWIHRGQTLGFRANLWYSPAEQITYVELINGRSSDNLAGALLPTFRNGLSTNGAMMNYNESVDGDISGDRNSPLALELTAGDNTLRATSSVGDLEYVTVTVPEGFQLDTVDLTSYASEDNVAFAAVQAGSVFTEPPTQTNISNLLGYSHFGTADLGSDILDDLAQGQGAIGFTAPLPSGTYTFWLQQTGEPSTYTLNFNVSATNTPTPTPTPEPTPEPDLPGTPNPEIPVVSLQTIAALFDSEDTLLAPVITQAAEDGTSILSFVLTAEGEIPEDGLIVTVNSDIQFRDYFAFLAEEPFIVGGELVGAVFNDAGEATGFQFKMTSSKALINLRPQNNTDNTGDKPFTFTLAASDAYAVELDAGTAAVTFYESLANVPTPAVIPEVSLSLDASTLNETTGNSATLTFSLSEPPPPEGLLVYVQGETGSGTRLLSEFDLFNATVTGGAFPVLDGSANGFFFKITDTTATLTLSAFKDEDLEGIKGVTFGLQEAPGYTIAAGSDSLSLNVIDNENAQIQVSVTTEPAILIESEQTVSVHTFSLSAAPPEEGLVVSIVAPDISEFDLSGISTEGGEIARVTPTGFDFKLTAKQATIELPVALDDEAEGLEEAVFTLQDTPDYQVNPATITDRFQIVDAPDQAPVLGVNEPNDTIDNAVDTNLNPNNPFFSLTSTIDFGFSNSYETDQGGTIYVDASEDVDFYKVSLKAGDTIKIDLDSNQFDEGRKVDTSLRIFDASGNQAGFNEDGAAPDELFAAKWASYLEFTAPSDGDYYLGVAIYENTKYDPFQPASGGGYSEADPDGYGTGEYTLNISLNDPSAFVAKPTVIPPGDSTGPVISLFTVAGTYGTDFDTLGFDILAPVAVETVAEGEVSVLNFVLTAEGEIPAEGVTIYIAADQPILDYLGTVDEFGALLSDKPFTRGGQFLDAIYDGTGTPIGFTFRLEQPFATIVIPVTDRPTAETDGSEDVTFSVVDSQGYTASALSQSTVTFYDSLNDVAFVQGGPIVSLELSTTELIESEETQITLTFNLSAPPPPSGTQIYVSGNAQDFLNEFSIFEAEFLGGIAVADGAVSGFYFQIFEQTATITLPVFNSTDITEGIEAFNLAIRPGAGYVVDEEKNGGTILIKDTPDSNIQVSLSTEPAVLIESEGTVAQVNLSLSAPPSAEGVLVTVNAAEMIEFDPKSLAAEGAELVSASPDNTSFSLIVKEQTAKVTVAVAADSEAEGVESAVFSLGEGEGYQINPETDSGTFTIVDTPDLAPASTAESNDTLETAIATGLNAESNPTVSFEGEIGEHTIELSSDEFLVIDGTEDVDLYKVELTAGQDLIIDVDATEIGSKLQFAQIRVFDAAGTELAKTGANSFQAAPDEVFSVFNDPYLEFTASDAGTYYVGISQIGNDYYDPNGVGSGSGWIFPAAEILPDKYQLHLSVGPELIIDPPPPVEVVTAVTQDLILGTDADDSLIGTDGDDRLNGLQGDDTYVGGSGADQFVLALSQGIDTITDFEVGIDRIKLAGLGVKGIKLFELSSDTLVLTNSNELLGVVQGVTGLDSSVFA